MAPQLTLQAPLELPPQDVSDYLGRLWNGGEQDSTSRGAATFSLLVWQAPPIRAPPGRRPPRGALPFSHTLGPREGLPPPFPPLLCKKKQ